ncbi:MAG: multi-sensor hybrid histidine kinase [Phycisphaerales bacterium]|jgi:CheY-like chemotaxis protein|nr:multi-sensor hybrid histidine kinase [Phycisphaerales bacterium]
MPLKILLVEDHADTAEVVSILVTRWGHAIDVASTLGHARRLTAECGTYDLLLCDIGLPDGSGAELMRELSSRCGTRGIALTGYGMPAEIDAARGAGFADHLLKPVPAQALKELLDREAARKAKAE